MSGGEPRSECSGEAPPVGVPEVPGFPETVRTFARIGLQSFGGPAGQIAVVHKVLVEEKRWISEERFLHALNYCMLLPGPEATQLVTYVGWLLHGTRGGVVAGLLFILPGFVAILALSTAYATLGDVGVVQSLLFGLKAAVLAVVVEAVVRIGRRVLKNGVMYAISAAAFVAIFAFHTPFPAIILGAAVLGFAGGKLLPSAFVPRAGRNAEGAAEHSGYATDGPPPAHTLPSLRRSLVTLATWVPLWLGPVAALRWWLGASNVFAVQALFFSKAAVVTFGGAYAVLAYVAQQAVEVYGWLEPQEMLTGLGMAETTPGPLIMVLQFVGYLGASRDPGGLDPLVAGWLASLLVAWVTFTPCFLWIFLGAPYVERARGKATLAAALTSITAAVVGVVLNLAVWMAVHTLFRTVGERAWGPVRVPAPDLRSIDPAAVVIACVAAACLFWLRWGVLRTLAAAVGLSVLWFALGARH